MEVSNQKICNEAGVNVYPEYDQGYWYIIVENNGRRTKYPKAVGRGYKLRGDEFTEKVHMVYAHWAKKIQAAREKLSK